MSEEIKDSVKEYYGKVLKSNKDLQTNACIQQTKNVPRTVSDALKLCHDEVLSRYYGCGLVFPSAVDGATVLDFGSGAGRDCFILSKLVGEDGFVTGIDMTIEQINVAKTYIPYHTETFGYSKPNVEFKLGYIENLKDAGVQDSTCDLIVSNCVINLSPDKPAVFKEAFRVLKEGGELYFSDIYADQELPEDIKSHKELWGECLAGALYWKSFLNLTKEVGFCGPYLVTSRNMTCGNEKLQKVLGNSKFVSATYRLFKTNKKTEKKCNHSVKYRGTISECPEKFIFDDQHTFDFTFQPVSSDIATVLKQSRYYSHFEFQETDSGSGMPCTTLEDFADPFKLANADEPSCCKKLKTDLKTEC